MCRRSPHKARPLRSSPTSESIVVTHPFHPLTGQRLVVILERRRPSTDLVLVCEGGPAGQVTLPAAWTDRAPAALSHRLGVEGLAALAELTAALHHPRVAHRGEA